MAFTGGVVRLGTGTEFGRGETRPRGCSGFGAESLYVVGNTLRRLIRITDIENATGEFASAQLPNGVNGLTEFSNAFYALAQGHLHRIDPPFNATTDSTDLGEIASDAQFRSLATDGTNLFAFDRTNEQIYLVAISGNTISASVYVTVTFPAAVTNPNVLAMFFFEGAFHFVETSQDALYRLPEILTVGGTAAATRVGNETQFGASVGTPHGAGVFDNEAYMVDASVRTLFRFYNVRWDQTIDPIEVNAGGNTSKDLSTVSKDATSYEFAPSNTARSWLSISGTEIIATNAPAVTADTDYEVVVRAVRGSAHEDKTLTVRVIADAELEMTVDPSSVLSGGIAKVTFTFNKVVGDFTDADVTVSTGATKGTLTDEGNNVWTMPITAPSSGSGTVTVSVGADVVTPGNNADSVQFDYEEPPPPVMKPSAPRNFRTTNIEPTSADFALDPPTDDGGAVVEYYEARIAEGTTIPTNTPWVAVTTDDSTTFTLSQLKKSTQYAVETRAVNTEGGGAASRILTFTTDATEPDAPTGLNPDTIGIREVETSWQNGENGGSPITGHQYRIQEGDTPGGTWENTDSTDTTHIFRNLKPSTQYTTQVRTLNAEGASQPSNAITFTTQVYVPMPPVWATGTALKTTIEAGASMTIDIGAKVSGADEIVEIFGLQFQWMEYNEATQILTLEDAPIVREDTEIRIRFIAENEDGETPEDYIITLKGSVFASLHNTLFFVEPWNYLPERVTRRGTSIVVPELSDNDYTTFSSHTDFNIKIADLDGNPTAFDYIFIKAKGTNIVYSITPRGGSGTGFTNRAIPETIKNIGGGEVSTIVNGFTHELYPLPERITATDVRLQISGTNLEIYAVMFLKIFWEINANSKFVQMAFEKVDRAGTLDDSPDGSIERAHVLGAERQKWEAQYTAVVGGSDVDEFMDAVEANLNCGFAREFSRHPADVYPAFFPALEMPSGYLGLVKSVGESIQFGVFEQ